jgi:hypothetical protein
VPVLPAVVVKSRRNGSLAALMDGGHTMTVTSSMVDAIAATSAGLRALGSAEGGYADNLRFLFTLTWCMWPDCCARPASPMWRSLTGCSPSGPSCPRWLAGLLARDAGEHGLAQRYFTGGLHAAHTAGIARWASTCWAA